MTPWLVADRGGLSITSGAPLGKSRRCGRSAYAWTQVSDPRRAMAMKRTIARAAFVLLASGAAHAGAGAVFDPTGSGIYPSGDGTYPPWSSLYDQYGIYQRPNFPDDAAVMPAGWAPQQYVPPPPSPQQGPPAIDKAEGKS
jgi:hypothetical protein